MLFIFLSSFEFFKFWLFAVTGSLITLSNGISSHLSVMSPAYHSICKIQAVMREMIVLMRELIV